MRGGNTFGLSNCILRKCGSLGFFSFFFWFCLVLVCANKKNNPTAEARAAPRAQPAAAEDAAGTRVLAASYSQPRGGGWGRGGGGAACAAHHETKTPRIRFQKIKQKPSSAAQHTQPPTRTRITTGPSLARRRPWPQRRYAHIRPRGDRSRAAGRRDSKQRGRNTCV
jgi:hypothetical protein